jgi:hypothetical protein
MAATQPIPQGFRATMSTISSRRSFAFMGSGALIGLILAGYSLFTARGTSTLFVPPEDVALVNQQPILRADYLQQLQTLYGVDLAHATPTERSKVLNDMIREELFVQRGKELDVASVDPEVRSAMVNSVELEIAADAITAQPSEGTMAVGDYVFPAAQPDVAAKAAAILRTTEPSPALLAQWHATASGKVAGSEFYFAAKIHLGDALFEAAKDLPDRGVSAPIALADGIHVLVMIKNGKPVPFDFEASKVQVLNDFRNDAIGRLRTEDEAFLRKRANILIAEDLR